MTSWFLKNDQRYRVDYSRTEPDRINWGWHQLWEQENPNPGVQDFDEWYALSKIERDRCVVADAFPQFNVWDWDNEDIQIARKLISRHTCAVCGRIEDPGCILGC